MFINTWLVLMPPVIVLCTALYTKKLPVALIAGIISAGFIATNFTQPLIAAQLILQRLYTKATDLDNVYTYIFLLLIGCLISLLNKTGGASAFARIFTTRLRSKRMVETASIGLSCSLCIDDYLSNLTAGHVMRPITDRFLIPRAKLAYLVHSMTGPFVILAPISSWAAMIINQLENAGANGTIEAHTKLLVDPLYLYLKTIPFMFYSILLITSVIFIVFYRISYGPMRTHEIIANTEHNLFGGKKAPTHADVVDDIEDTNNCISDFLLPLCSLIVTVLGGIAYAGNYWLFGGSATFLQAVRNNQQPFLVMAIAGCISFSISTLYALLRSRVKVSDMPGIMWYGSQLMWPPIVMVFLASTLGLILEVDLHTGSYLASLLIGNIQIALLPALFYIASLIITIATGSAWATIALMLPIALPMVTRMSGLPLPIDPSTIPIIYPVLGALFSGAVCGDHISPISETTIMASSSAGTYPMDHVKTQLPYALPAVSITLLSFVVAGFMPTYNTALLSGLIIGGMSCLVLIYVLNSRKK